MCKEVLFTGVKVSRQLQKANEILNSQVIPKEKLFQQRKQKGELTWNKNTRQSTNA